MTKPVTRYSFFVSEDTHGPYVEDQEDPDGQWVKYTDIEAMLIEQGLRDFKIATHPSFGTTDEPKAERQGVTFGCSKCSDTVTLLFTDATKKSIDIRPMNGWVAGPGGCFCPRCAPNRTPPHE
jgi:hypothetical protein